RLAALPDRRLLKQPRRYARMEFAPFLLEERGVGSFLNRHVLEHEDGVMGFLDAIHDPGALQSLQCVFQRFASAWKHAGDALIIELPSEHGGDLGHALGGTESVKALHQ